MRNVDQSRRPAFPLLVVAAFLAISLPIEAANAKAWTPADDLSGLSDGDYSFSLIERGSEGGHFSEIFLAEPSGPNSSTVWTNCTELGVFPCDLQTINKTKSEIRGYLVMPVCASTSDEDCIEGVSIFKVGEDPIQAELIAEVPGTSIIANKSIGVPRSTMPSLWRAPGAIHAGGQDTYAVQFLQDILIKNGKVSYDFLQVTVMPYNEIAVTSSPVSLLEQQDSKNRKIYRPSFSENGYTWSGEGVAGEPQDFSENTRVRVSIRAPKAYGGWFKGRLFQPNIKVKSFSSRSNLITVEANVVDVPRVLVTVSKDSWTPNLAKLFPEVKRLVDNGGSGATATPNEGSWAMRWVEALSKPAKDTAAGINRVWNFSTLPSGIRSSNPCLADSSRVLGIVSTNAAVFDGAAPEFRGGFLNYQVAGMHYLPDGVTKARGSYDLVIRSDVARCLYGFPKVPVSATVQVVNDKGNKTFASSIVGEKNGWLKLGAYNFTFSKKTIKVKVTKAKRAK